MHLNGREQALKHEGHDLVGVIVWSLSEAVHDQQGSVLQLLAEYFRVPLVALLILNHILGKGILSYLKSNCGPFRVLDNTQVA